MIKVTKLSLCEAQEPGMTLLQNKRTWTEGVKICTGLGGQVEWQILVKKRSFNFKVVVGRTSEIRDRMKKLVMETDAKTCWEILLGFTDLEKEGHWVDWQTGEEISKNMTKK